MWQMTVEILTIIMFWSNVVWSWAFITGGCVGGVFIILDAYTRRDEIANKVLLDRANALLRKAQKEAKKKRYANV